MPDAANITTRAVDTAKIATTANRAVMSVHGIAKPRIRGKILPAAKIAARTLETV